MRYAPEHNEATRHRIVEVASRLFREEGSDGVGLARVMAEAGLTVGTFYSHFDSKEALLREMLERTLAVRHEALAAALSDGALERAVRAYLSAEHRDRPATGCVVAALAPEVARHAKPTRAAYAAGLAPSTTLLAEALSQHRGAKVSVADATAFFGLLVGTLQLARATPVKAEADAILEAGIRAALQLAGAPKRRGQAAR